MPTISPDQRIKAAGARIAAALDKSLAAVAGEKVGFVLLVWPLGRDGESNLLSNVKRDASMRAMQATVDSYEPEFIPYSG